MFPGEGSVPRPGGSGSRLSARAAPAPWPGFREAGGSEGCCRLPGGICADRSKASEGPRCDGSSRQLRPSELPRAPRSPTLACFCRCPGAVIPSPSVAVTQQSQPLLWRVMSRARTRPPFVRVREMKAFAASSPSGWGGGLTRLSPSWLVEMRPSVLQIFQLRLKDTGEQSLAVT